LRRELGRDPHGLYVRFDDRPLAAASIGQVHAATLADGREVVVKLRRPGVVSSVEQDLVVLDLAASLLARLPGAIRRVDVVGFVEQFAETIRGELDYVAEGHNADRARTDLADLPVHVPEVVWEATTHGVLTLERISGVKIDDLAGLDRIGADRPALARSLAYVYLSMVFSHGFFHADPHPGNLFVEPSGRLAMVDFGMVGTVTPEVRKALVEIIFALVTHDTRRTVAAMRGLGVAPAGVDEDVFVAELDRLTASSIEIPVGELRLAPLVADLMTVSRRHRLAFPRELALLVKTVVMCEGLAAQLDPTFALPEVLVGFVADAFGASDEGPGAGTRPRR
jgi:ubiquinone biosynthesis protein